MTPEEGYREAEKRIEEARSSGAETLDISDLNLTHIPDYLAQLSQLKELSFHGNKLSTLPEWLGQLSQLHKLYLGTNQLTDLPESLGNLSQLHVLYLFDNQLTELPELLGQLSQIRILNLEKNKLTTIPESLGQLSKLRKLFISNNRLTIIPESIGQLSQLQRLDIFRNQLEALPESLGKLSQLQRLDISYNQLRTLPDSLGQLSQLKEFILLENQITALPVSMGQLSKLNHLAANNNPLTNPPLEIVSKGIEAIREYFKAAKTHSRQLNEVKVLLVGDGESGKTSLIKQLLEQKFDPNESQTHGININRYTMKNGKREILVNFWDFGGQEIMHSTHQFFLSKRSLYILVIDIRRDHQVPDYWLEYIESFGGNSPIMVVLNKIDENPGNDIDRRSLKIKYKEIVGFHRVSCKTREGINEFIESLCNALSNVDISSTIWPEKWFFVKQQMEEMENPYISYTEFQGICIQADIKDYGQQKVLLEFLHDLGIVLYFPDFRLSYTQVIKPEWVTNGVYRIINSKELADAKGILELRMLAIIFENPEESKYHYTPEKYIYLLDLMLKFELCYEIDANRVLIPELLDVQEPNIPDDFNNSQKYVFDYGFLPKSILPRFMVRMHTDIDPVLCWRTGAVLRDTAGAKAVVRADYHERKIFIDVVGQGVREYLTVIRFTMQNINSSFSKLGYYERIPLPDNPKLNVEYDHLLNLERMGIKEFLPEGADRLYSIKELLGCIYVESKTIDDVMNLFERIADKMDTEKSFPEKANKIIRLKPNIHGIGIDINEIVEMFLEKRKTS
jgi:internalin A